MSMHTEHITEGYLQSHGYLDCMHDMDSCVADIPMLAGACVAVSHGALSAHPSTPTHPCVQPRPCSSIKAQGDQRYML